MIQIRKNVFETNSSSSHSLCVLKEDKPLACTVDSDWIVDSEGILRFYDYSDDLEFGRWPFRILSDWYDRLCYALASYSGNKEKREEITNICRRRIDNFKNFEFYEHTWWDEERDSLEERYQYGCVDHQSADLLHSFLESHNISLEEFIFNDRYLVIIDGDEYHYFDKLQELPVWNADTVEEIYD